MNIPKHQKLAVGAAMCVVAITAAACSADRPARRPIKSRGLR
jgi:hypothetical protein